MKLKRRKRKSKVKKVRKTKWYYLNENDVKNIGKRIKNQKKSNNK